MKIKSSTIHSVYQDNRDAVSALYDYGVVVGGARTSQAGVLTTLESVKRGLGPQDRIKPLPRANLARVLELFLSIKCDKSLFLTSLVVNVEDTLLIDVIHAKDDDVSWRVRYEKDDNVPGWHKAALGLEPDEDDETAPSDYVVGVLIEDLDELIATEGGFEAMTLRELPEAVESPMAVFDPSHAELRVIDSVVWSYDSDDEDEDCVIEFDTDDEEDDDDCDDEDDDFGEDDDGDFGDDDCDDDDDDDDDDDEEEDAESDGDEEEEDAAPKRPLPPPVVKRVVQDEDEDDYERP